MSADLTAKAAPARDHRRRANVGPWLSPESTLRRILRNPRILVCGVFLALIGLISLAAPLVAPQDPTAMAARLLLEPSRQYPLGTDDFGRDALSRLDLRGRVSFGSQCRR